MRRHEEAIKLEIARRKEARRRPWNPYMEFGPLAERPYPAQQAVWEDKHRDLALTGTRQYGKTRLAAIMGVDMCLGFPGTESIYGDLTIDHAVKVLMPELRALHEAYRIDATVGEDHMRFKNGSVFHCMSLANAAETRKLQGHRPKLFWFDEMQDLSAHIGSALEIVRPAMARHEGRIVLSGIPGHVLTGAWYEATEGANAHLYGQHRGSMLANPWIPNAAQELEMARLRLGEDNPLFQRHWLGKWAHDPDAMVYRYDQARNGYKGDAPVTPYYAIGLDPAGTSDREALVVIGFGGRDGKIWHVADVVTDAGAGGSFDDTADRLVELDERYQPVKTFYDYGSAKKALPTFYRRDKAIRVEPVPFKDLDVEISRVNSLLLCGRLMVRQGSDLELDLMTVTWDDRARAVGRHQYTSACHPDVADAMRAALHGVDAGELSAPPLKPANDVEREKQRIQDVYDAVKKPKYGPADESESGIGRHPTGYGPPGDVY